MARAFELGQRVRTGMDGSSLAMRQVIPESRFDPNMNRFMLDARRAGVLVMDGASRANKSADNADELPHEAGKAAIKTMPQQLGSVATPEAVALDTELSDERIAEMIEAEESVKQTSG